MTPASLATGRGSDAPAANLPSVWAVAALPDRCTSEERAAFAGRASADPRADRLVLVTCHRAELYGSGPGPDEAELIGLAGGPEFAGRLERFAGDEAVRHVLRLAAGLESVVVGEDQVLHQVRSLRAGSLNRPTDPHLARLVEVAIGVGRNARAVRSSTAYVAEPDLASRAFDWLRLAGHDGSDEVLVVGAGEMGRLLAVEARRRGMDVLVASRDPGRARRLAATVGGRPMDLGEASAAAPFAGAVAVALGGPWSPVGPPAEIPPMVDLSSPPAVPPAAAARLLDIDGLYRWCERARFEHPGSDAGIEAYVRAATSLVDEAADGYARWAAGRSSVETLRRLRECLEARRLEALERLLRRMPDLEAHERALVEAFSEQLVNGMLHSPTARLREDVDGTAAEAALRLFDL